MVHANNDGLMNSYEELCCYNYMGEVSVVGVAGLREGAGKIQEPMELYHKMALIIKNEKKN